MCGLNLLSCFGLIDSKVANELTVCALQSPSIFTILDYINLYERKMGLSYNKYMVTRISLDYSGGEWLLDNFYPAFRPGKMEKLNYVMFFKICIKTSTNSVFACIYRKDGYVYYLDENNVSFMISRINSKGQFTIPYDSFIGILQEKYPAMNDYFELIWLEIPNITDENFNRIYPGKFNYQITKEMYDDEVEDSIKHGTTQEEYIDFLPRPPDPFMASLDKFLSSDIQGKVIDSKVSGGKKNKKYKK